MTDYISREAENKIVCELCENNAGTFCIKCDGNPTRDIPAADVRLVVRAKWKDDWETGCSECSACGEGYLWEDYDGVGEWNFCPNCGADMREANDEKA